MPELPEVETVVRDLRRKIVGRRIVAVWTDWPKIIKDPAAQSRLHVSEPAVAHFKKETVGRTVERVERRAKNILIYLSGNHLILVHQKMTGHFLVGKWRIQGGEAVGVSPRAIIEDSFNHHVHLILTLDNGEQVGLSDVRKFAKVLFGTRAQIEALRELVKLGPDALDHQLSVEQFSRIVQCQKRPIKQVLMDPFVIAGIGNIYANDSLFIAKINPLRKSNTLTPTEISALYKAVQEIIAEGLLYKGSSARDEVYILPDGSKGSY
jgi:formamidopyrimidine-DNA glycosylase